MVIVGAGMTGLLAAHLFPRAVVIESQTEQQLKQNAHSALLRFRSDAISRVTGIEFKKVLVRKGIWHNGAFRTPSIQLANLYSNKVIGKTLDRSIWDLEPVHRYIAPDDFQSQLLNAVGERIQYNSRLAGPGWSLEGLQASGDACVSTMPMPLLIDRVSADPVFKSIEFGRADIRTTRFRIPGAMVYQTIYLPGNETNVYRASMTGDTMIIEGTSSGPLGETIGDAIALVMRAFGLSDIIPDDWIETRTQSMGKIAPIDDKLRRKFIYEVTRDYNIYSAGRYAIWKNVLMDDVLDDLLLIKRMITSADNYAAHREAHK